MAMADEIAFKEGIRQSLLLQPSSTSSPTSTSTPNISINGSITIESEYYNNKNKKYSDYLSTITNNTSNNNKKDSNTRIMKKASNVSFSDYSQDSNTAIANESNYYHTPKYDHYNYHTQPQPQQQYNDTSNTIILKHMPECSNKMITSNNSMDTLCSETIPREKFPLPPPATTSRDKLPSRPLLQRTPALFPGQVVYVADEEEREEEEEYSSAKEYPFCTTTTVVDTATAAGITVVGV